VVALAEGLAALTRPRAYRGALTLDEALAEIRALSGVQYDPSLVALLDGCMPLLAGSPAPLALDPGSTVIAAAPPAIS
jgi:HD-GYP domain-containing protein (c-di-GMP phosphodiesterase class II)